MKKIIIYLLIPVIFMTVATSCKWNKGLPSLKETFSSSDSIPFGTFVCRNQLVQLFDHNSIGDIKQNFSIAFRDAPDSAAIYICISRNLFLTQNDKVSMLNFVNAGNTVFISSAYIDKELLNQLHCTESRELNVIKGINSVMDYTSEQMDTALYNDRNLYNYFYFPFNNFFSAFDSSATTILGRNDDGLPDFIIVYYGKGRFYLHCEPRAFSNYFLLQKNNYRYLQNAFSFMPGNPDAIYWDDYYNKHNLRNPKDNEGALSMLLRFPSMAWAFWLSLSLLLLFILFEGKRRQRQIAILPPNSNTTLAFTETVGRVYYQQKNNKNIAEKMITYLLENIRNQYFLNTNQLNDTFIETLSRKSSVPKAVLDELVKTIHAIREGSIVSDQQLLTFNRQIENFYKNKI